MEVALKKKKKAQKQSSLMWWKRTFPVSGGMQFGLVTMENIMETCKKKNPPPKKNTPKIITTLLNY